MIERTVFATWMGVFADRLNRPLAVPTLGAYYATLSARLDTEQFERGAKALFERWTYPNWPPPAEFIAGAVTVVPVALEGAAAWQAIADVLSRYCATPEQHAQRWRDAETVAGPAGWCAFNAAGGYARWKQLLDDESKWFRRDFLAAFPAAKQYAEAVDKDTTRLPPAVRGLITSLTRGMSMPRALPAHTSRRTDEPDS